MVSLLGLVLPSYLSTLSLYDVCFAPIPSCSFPLSVPNQHNRQFMPFIFCLSLEHNVGSQSLDWAPKMDVSIESTLVSASILSHIIHTVINYLKFYRP